MDNKEENIILLDEIKPIIQGKQPKKLIIYLYLISILFYFALGFLVSQYRHLNTELYSDPFLAVILNFIIILFIALIALLASRSTLKLFKEIITPNHKEIKKGF